MSQRTFGQVILGVLAALLSLTIVMGSLALILMESSQTISLNVTATNTVLPVTLIPSATWTAAIPTKTLKPGETPLPTATFLPATMTPTISEQVYCTPPAGWLEVQIMSGDTLQSLAEAYQTTPEILSQANCLVTTNLLVGMSLYVPGQVVSPTPACGRPTGWVVYVVQPGDTLYHIGQVFGVSVYQLQVANCLGGATLIQAGQQLFVPNVPTRTLVATSTPTPPFTPTQTQTVLISTPTQTFTPFITTPVMVTPTFTETPFSASPTPSETSLPTQQIFTPTPTLTPTEMIPETATPTPSLLPDTATPTPFSYP